MAAARLEGSPWWEDRTGYQVYLPSFADSDGDGWGDLPGLVGRLDYLADLGVDLLWLSPIHPSPFADAGYDVADYTAVHPRFGTLGDVDRLLSEAGERGMRVLLDLVPNHTSSQHAWFRDARASRQDPYRDYYIWADPDPDGGPPNNWVSAFGGPAWTLEEATGQYYLHLFTPAQPDLNWDNPAVADEFDRILRFWLDRGVAGFRIDVAHTLIKAPGLPSNPELPADQWRATMTGLPEDHFRFDHRYESDQPGVLDVHRRWRRVAEPYGALLLGEVYLLEPAKLRRYLIDQGGLHLSFWFGLVESGWQPHRFAQLLRVAEHVGPHLAWVQSSHDRSRAVTRYGGGAAGRRRAMLLATVMAGLPALPVLYQGEELGLEDGAVPAELVQDPLVLQGGYALPRDTARTPMPWSSGHGFGFTSARQAWTAFGGRTTTDTVEYQAANPTSSLAAHRRLLATRRRLSGLRRGTVRWLDTTPSDVLAYRRGDVLVAANLGDTESTLQLPAGSWEVDYCTDRDDGTLHDGRVLRLGAEHAVILRAEPHHAEPHEEEPAAGG